MTTTASPVELLHVLLALCGLIAGVRVLGQSLLDLYYEILTVLVRDGNVLPAPLTKPPSIGVIWFCLQMPPLSPRWFWARSRVRQDVALLAALGALGLAATIELFLPPGTGTLQERLHVWAGLFATLLIASKWGVRLVDRRVFLTRWTRRWGGPQP